MTVDTTPLDAGMRAHFERCHPALSRLRVIAHLEEPGPGTTAAAIQALERVLAELRAAAHTVTTPAGQPSVTTFLRRRLTRLDNSAEDVLAALIGKDAPALRRRLQHFCALAAATWKVQLSLHAPARATDRPLRR